MGRKSWWKVGLLVAASIVTSLAIAEGAVRLLAPQPTGLSHQDRYGLALHYPGITRYLPQYGHSVSFNSGGMRDREHALDKRTEVFRILLLGDSFMEALQVPFEAALPSLLETDLAKRTGRKVEVINAGVSGWGTDDELRYLTEYGLRYSPDLVVVAMTLHNDISDNLREHWHTVRGGRLVDQPRAPIPFLDYKIVELKAFIATRLQLYQLWRRARHRGEIVQTRRQLDSHVVQLFREPAPERITYGYELTGLLLEKMKEVTAAAGGQLAVVLLPLRVQLTDSSFAEFVRAAGSTEDGMPPARPQRIMTSIADGLSIPVIDLLPAFREWSVDSAAPLYLEWDGHWNGAGHRLATESVVEGLVAVVGGSR